MLTRSLLPPPDIARGAPTPARSRAEKQSFVPFAPSHAASSCCHRLPPTPAIPSQHPLACPPQHRPLLASPPTLLLLETPVSASTREAPHSTWRTLSTQNSERRERCRPQRSRPQYHHHPPPRQHRTTPKGSRTRPLRAKTCSELSPPKSSCGYWLTSRRTNLCRAPPVVAKFAPPTLLRCAGPAPS